MNRHRPLTLLIVLGAVASPASAQEKPVVGLVPKAQKPVAMDGKLTGWASAASGAPPAFRWTSWASTKAGGRSSSR
jgi:hypothetical protein